MVRVAIVGCGKIANQHVQAVQRIPGSSVVAVCDREPLMARQLAERFRIRGCFADVEDMLRATSPDVVHVTTPPQSHVSLLITTFSNSLIRFFKIERAQSLAKRSIYLQRISTFSWRRP